MAFVPHYPFEEIEFGQILEVERGVYWLRMPLPFALNHINLWLLEDGDNWTVIDTGYNNKRCQSIWETVLSQMSDDRVVARTICSHFHPDHLGLAGWFGDKFGASLWMTYTEWLQAHVAISKTLTHDFHKWVEFYQAHGAPHRMSSDFKEIIKSFEEPWYALPSKVRRIQDNESIAIDGRSWTVITGAGHTHEHASFWCEELNILISGDQILPRITSNISLWHTEPDGNPLKHYLESFEKYEELPEDVLVLPSHDYPFKGLHGRLDDLRNHHQQRLEVTQEKCAIPRTAAEIIPYLFTREINAFEFSFAIGETLAHLNYLLHKGSLECVTGGDGLIRYRSV